MQICACMRARAHTHTHTHTHIPKKSLKFIMCVYNVTILQVWYAQAQQPIGYFQPIIKVIFHSSSLLFTTTSESAWQDKTVCFQKLMISKSLRALL